MGVVEKKHTVSISCRIRVEKNQKKPSDQDRPRGGLLVFKTFQSRSAFTKTPRATIHKTLSQFHPMLLLGGSTHFSPARHMELPASACCSPHLSFPVPHVAIGSELVTFGSAKLHRVSPA